MHVFVITLWRCGTLALHFHTGQAPTESSCWISPQDVSSQEKVKFWLKANPSEKAVWPWCPPGRRGRILAVVTSRFVPLSPGPPIRFIFPACPAFPGPAGAPPLPLLLGPSWVSPAPWSPDPKVAPFLPFPEEKKNQDHVQMHQMCSLCPPSSSWESELPEQRWGSELGVNRPFYLLDFCCARSHEWSAPGRLLKGLQQTPVL